MYCWIFGEFVFIVLAGLCSANEQRIPFTRYFADNDLDNFTCSGRDILFSKGPVSRVGCASLCENKNQCAGFTYRDSDKKCVGCTDGPATIVSADPGMVFFEPTERKWGLPCTSLYTCTGENQQCMDNVCVCIPGYSFNATSWTCVASCGIYGDTFQMYPGKAIAGYNLDCVSDVTVKQCFKVRQDTTSCRSVDYAPSISVCCVQAVTPLDVPEAYVDRTIDDFYNRNC